MKHTMAIAALASLVGSVGTNALATTGSSKEQAIALVKKAIDLSKKIGTDKAFSEFNRLDSPFNGKSPINPHGDLYILVYQFDGIQPVHGKNPEIPGKNVLEMRDADKVYLVKEMIKACKSKQGNGWVSYKWRHPLTGSIQAKHTYVERSGDLCYGTGIYP